MRIGEVAALALFDERALGLPGTAEIDGSGVISVIAVSARQPSAARAAAPTP